MGTSPKWSILSFTTNIDNVYKMVSHFFGSLEILGSAILYTHNGWPQDFDPTGSSLWINTETTSVCQ